MRKIILLLLLFFFVLSSHADAKQGCCSWHGGVSYCEESSGRYVCNDGSYSPSCTCGAPPSYVPVAPQTPSTPVFKIITGTPDYEPNSYGSFTINFTLEDPEPGVYSAIISRTAGSNPGPTTDFTTTKFTFYNVAPGKWYINSKKIIDGYWSNIQYWPINVPVWTAPTSTPTPTLLPTPTFIPSPTPIPVVKTRGEQTSSSGGYIVGGGLLYLSYLIGKTIFNRKVEK